MFAEDDPMIGKKNVNPELVYLSDYLMMGVTKHGGHFGYFESLFTYEQFYTKPMMEFLNAYKN